MEDLRIFAEFLLTAAVVLIATVVICAIIATFFLAVFSPFIVITWLVT